MSDQPPVDSDIWGEDLPDDDFDPAIYGDTRPRKNVPKVYSAKKLDTALDGPLLESPKMSKKARIITAVALVGAFGLMVFGCFLNADVNDAAIENNEGLLALFPERGDQVVRQTNVGAQLAEGYSGRLTVADREITGPFLIGGANSPDNRVITRVGATGTNSAGETLDPVLPTLSAGTNCAEIAIWQDDRPNDVVVERWCFEVL